MLPSHQFYSGSNLNDSNTSFTSTHSCDAAEIDLPPIEPRNSYQSNVSKNNDYDEILQLIQHPHHEDDLDLSDDDDLPSSKYDMSEDPIASTKNEDAQHVEHPILIDTSSDLPISSKFTGQGRSQQFSEDETPADNRNKRQKLHRSQSSQNHPLENSLYPAPSKKWSPHLMETPPASTTEETDSGKDSNKWKRYYVQPIPIFRPKEQHSKPQTTEKQIHPKDKENAPVPSNPLPVVHLRQQIKDIDSNDNGRDRQIVTKQSPHQNVTNHSNHPGYKPRLSIHRDNDEDNDDHGHVNNNLKEVPLPLSSISINQANRQQSNVEKHHDKQQHQHDLDQHNRQTKNDKVRRLSGRNHNQEPPRSTNDKKELTGEIQVKGHLYSILKKIGYGGSSSVYRVLHQKSHEVMALKYIPTKDLKDATIKDYRNEINFLTQLPERCRRHIPHLYNYEFNRLNHDLAIVLELGETDLATCMDQQKSRPLNMNFVRWHGQQMIEIVAEIHNANIVHRDLKPGNFILKAGSLKLIDFGISRKVDPLKDTVTIDTPTGTTNYMAPEAFTWISHNRKKYTQIGRPSDIWSLGCILYQMIYGRTPFYEIPTDKKSAAICDLSHKIHYPPVVHFKPSSSKKDENTVEIKVGKDAVHLLQSCLDRNPLTRPTAKELLEHRFFHPASSTL